jgi:HrpA-like RNA helicase
MILEATEKSKNFRSSEYALKYLDHLPVAHLRDHLREEIRLHPNFVLIGETGSGKTTCLPPLLLEMRNELKLEGGIAVTQPRRLATRSVTDRVAGMMQCSVGDQVGYHVRFENVTSEETDITFMTDGILLRKIQFDPLLSEYSIVMIDEAHEQSTNIILSLGLLKEVNGRREQLNLEPIRIIVTSATIERNRFAQYISDGDEENSVAIEGKMFPVEVSYEKEAGPDYNFIEGAAAKVKEILDKQIAGDILIFMPGKKEIADTIDGILSTVGNKDIVVFPLHAELPPEEQDKIFEPTDKRKVIVATNIAETSITIDGIIHVIDSGLIKQTQFNPQSGIEQLVLTEHALSGLEQRKGRAGRTAPGYCYRLFTEDSLKLRPEYQESEILRSNLAQVVLTMKKIGIDNVADFDFLDCPNKNAIKQALATLTSLGALDTEGHITEIGNWMVELALEPCLGRMMIEALQPEINCPNEISIINSFLNGKNVFIRPEDKEKAIIADKIHAKFTADCDSDFVVFLNLWQAYQDSGYSAEWAQANYLNEKALEEVKNVRLDILDVLSQHGVNIDPEEKPKIRKNAISLAITSGFVGNLMKKNREGNGFSKVDGTKTGILIHPGSIFARKQFSPGSFVVAGEIYMNPEGKTFACNCLEVKRGWLDKYTQPYLFTSKNNRHNYHRRSDDSSPDTYRKPHHKKRKGSNN